CTFAMCTKTSLRWGSWSSKDTPNQAIAPRGDKVDATWHPSYPPPVSYPAPSCPPPRALTPTHVASLRRPDLLERHRLPALGRLVHFAHDGQVLRCVGVVPRGRLGRADGQRRLAACDRTPQAIAPVFPRLPGQIRE